LPTPLVWLSSMRSVMRSALGQSGSVRLSGSSSPSRPCSASLTASAATNIFVIEKIGNGVSAVTGAFVARLARPEPPDQNGRPPMTIAAAIPVARSLSR
jgi:hypothetical protein